MAKPKRNYEDLNEEEKARYDKLMKRSENMTAVGNGMMGVGCAVALLGIVITIIIAVLFIFIF